jgi:AcrR family transcriptional regulator
VDGALHERLSERAGDRTPRQQRSRRTMLRIVEAAETRFAERGYEGAVIGDIARLAGCSVGAVYARFLDKESLFHHVHAAQCERMVETAEALGRSPGVGRLALPALLEEVASALFRFATRRRALTRVFMQRSGNDAAFHARYAEAWGRVTRALGPLILERRYEIGHVDPEAAVVFVLQILHSLWANDVLHHGRREIAIRREAGELARLFAEVAAGYLHGDGLKVASGATT